MRGEGARRPLAGRGRPRGWVPALVAACCALAPALGRAQGDAPAPPDAGARRPNVLFIAIDDLNDWVGALGGHPQAWTPNIDRLAARGVLFTHAYASAPSCNPSRASLMTGIAPSTSGVYDNTQLWRSAMPDAVTIPQYFRQHGYRAEAHGKILHHPDPVSWDEVLPPTPDPMPRRRPLNGIAGHLRFDWGPLDVPEAFMGDRQVADWAAAFLARAHAQPFFLGVGFSHPHLPWYAPRKYFEPFPPASIVLPKVKPDDLDDVPEAGRRMVEGSDHRLVLATRTWANAVAAYLADVAFVDAMVGRVLVGLDAGPNARDTIVVLWSDHGFHLGEKQHWRKFVLWEEATRVPLIIAAPGYAVGRSSARTVSLLDLYPTLCELAGLPLPPGLEGRSLAPLLADPEAAWDRPVVSTNGRGNHAVRSERWRYIRYADGSEELYDHLADPKEWTNVASLPENAEVKRALAAWLPKVDAAPAPRPQRKKRLHQPK